MSKSIFKKKPLNIGNWVLAIEASSGHSNQKFIPSLVRKPWFLKVSVVTPLLGTLSAMSHLMLSTVGLTRKMPPTKHSLIGDYPLSMVRNWQRYRNG
ncbi:Uncharacterised protein [Vibrio cholerae]|nr:Uncharacterised protein [Vibrio cholerae]